LDARTVELWTEKCVQPSDKNYEYELLEASLPTKIRKHKCLL